MMKRSVLLSSAALALAACNAPLDTAQSVELTKFQGKWYEIAHLPRTTQSGCASTIATYTLRADGQLDFVHECTLPNGAYHGATAHARVLDVNHPAKLGVDFGGVLGDYWILNVSPDYRYALVGHPSRDYLWILSRTPTMDPKDLKVLLDDAQAKAFDTSKLEYTKQSGGDPQGTPASAVSYGCSATGGGAGAGFLALLVVGGLVVLRRRAKR